MSKTYVHGDHVCALYEGQTEQLEIAARYVAEGLRTGEKCLFVTGSSHGLTEFNAALLALGIDPDRARRRGALQLATNAQVHLDGGRFSSERMLRLLSQAVEDALDAGFQGLRTCGDMTWLLDLPAGHEEVVEYEALLNQLFKGVHATGMCLFDRARLPLSVLDHAIATHSSVSIGGVHKMNPFYEPPALAARRNAQPDRVAGKIAVLHNHA